MVSNKQEYTKAVLPRLKFLISELWVYPFIKSLPEGLLNPRKILVDTVHSLNENHTPDRRPYTNEGMDPSKCLFKLSNNNVTFLIGTKLSTTYIHLILLYTDLTYQERFFPQFNDYQIQTAIREVFFEYLNPDMNSFKEKLIKEQALLPIVLGLPVELAQICRSFLDYKSCKSFAMSCKSAYFCIEIVFRDQKMFSIC